MRFKKRAPAPVVKQPISVDFNYRIKFQYKNDIFDFKYNLNLNSTGTLWWAKGTQIYVDYDTVVAKLLTHVKVYGYDQDPKFIDLLRTHVAKNVPHTVVV